MHVCDHSREGEGRAVVEGVGGGRVGMPRGMRSPGSPFRPQMSMTVSTTTVTGNRACVEVSIVLLNGMVSSTLCSLENGLMLMSSKMEVIFKCRK